MSEPSSVSIEGVKPKVNGHVAPPSASHESNLKRTLVQVPPTPPAKELKAFPPLRTSPTRVIHRAQPIPLLTSSRRLSFSSLSSNRKPTKYGEGKYSHVELIPQPSDEEDDPLNWPSWKKELNLGALLSMVALVGVMKTVFVTVNSRLATSFMVSYTAVAALTGVPLIISALSGLLSVVAAKVWGKRPVYLASTLLIFVGAVWSTSTARSYGQTMAARVFQGLGWGAFDTLVLGSIHDTYFEHERGLRVAIYHIVLVSTTWGGPLLGGVASRTVEEFTLQFKIVAAFLAVAVSLIALGAPETNFDRMFTMVQTPLSAWSLKKLPLKPRGPLTLASIKEYVFCMRAYSYDGPKPTVNIIMQAPRAAVAPTTLLLSLVSLLPMGALWGLASSLSLLFSPMPSMLSTSSLGALMTSTWLMVTATVVAFTFLPIWQKRFKWKYNTAAIAVGAALSFTGILAFGLYIESRMRGPAAMSRFTLNKPISYPAVSFTLGLLAAGAYVLDATVRPMVRRSTQFTSSNVAAALRHTADMEAGVQVWRSLVAGVFVLGIPNAVWAWDGGLKATAIGLATVQAVVAAAVAAIWWVWDERIRRVDGRVMGCVDLDLLRRTGSFFDVD